MRERHMPAIRAVNVRMAGMRPVLGTCCHRVLLSRSCDLPGRPAWQPNVRKTAARGIVGLSPPSCPLTIRFGRRCAPGASGRAVPGGVLGALPIRRPACAD
jgi:hypothetical protein